MASKHEAERERPKFFWSHQSVEPKSFRWWSYIRGRDFLSIEVALLTGSFGIGVGIEHGKWTASVRVGLVSLYVSVPGKYRSYGEDREIEISFHHDALYWRFWTDPMSWSSSTPKWRHGSFNVPDFFLGRSKCTHETIEAQDIVVPMPEKAYPAKAELQRWTWKRPRWFAKTIMRAQIEIPGGIPLPGKGENSWDCGDDATFSITCQAKSIPEGVGVLVGSVLRDRVRYGGWGDWMWSRAAEPA